MLDPTVSKPSRVFVFLISFYPDELALSRHPPGNGKNAPWRVPTESMVVIFDTKALIVVKYK